MFKILYIRELQGYLYSLRFQISFTIVLLVFIVGTISFISSFTDAQANYAKLAQERQKTMEQLVQNASELAVRERSYIFNPQDYALISNCKENILPNRITYSAYNVFGFGVRYDSNNPLMKQMQGLNWAFIVSMILSFMTLLLAFDAISGEKEDHTLALVFSNSVSRGAVLLSKFLGIITIMMVITIIGMVTSLLIVILSGKVAVDSLFLNDAGGFLLVSTLFIAVMAIIGLLASTISRQSNISLLICLSVWIFFAVILPNSSVFFANKLFAISNASKVEQEYEQEESDINKNAPEGSWSSYGGNPFHPRHELRANNQTNLMNAHKRHYDAYYADMFRQFERTRNLLSFSPIAQFEYMSEAMLGGGYMRFQKNWNDLHIFQTQFLQWFKDLDAKDNGSPHWYNPYEALSTTMKPVTIDQVPVYIEKQASFGERFLFMINYLIVMVGVIGVLFIFCVIRFTKYDIR